MGMNILTILVVTIFALPGSASAMDAKIIEETNATIPVFIPASDLK